jgi:hypothetical protein
MANPTTNYGFVLPTSSDLVTDLPADFDVALQGVDTRLKALQPGTTLGDLAYSSATANTNTRLPIGTNGQVLAVSGGVPTWTTTADVTPLTTKGDLFTFTTVDARIGVGANGTVLTADSAEPTGLKWATASSGQAAAPTCTAYTNGNMSWTGGTPGNFTYTSEETDTDGFHNNSTNTDRMTIPTGFGGVYVITISYLLSGAGSSYHYLQIQKNGANMNGTTVMSDPQGRGSLTIIAALVAGDYVTASLQQSSTGTYYTERRFSVTRVGL